MSGIETWQLLNVGCGKYSGTIATPDDDNDQELVKEIKKHLASKIVEIFWESETEGTILVGGFRPVGKVRKVS